MDVFDHIQPDPSDKPVFLMCRPVFLSTKIPNNTFMEGKNHEEADVPRALNQMDRVSHVFESLGVEILEIPPQKGAQDQVYTANIGMCIGNTFVLANYKAPGRAIEVEPARKYLTSLGYNCIQPPFFFEGEADCKKWKDGIYFGGYGLFSTNEAFDWIEKQCGVRILRVKEMEEAQFHIDCSLMVVDEENFIVSRKGISKESLALLKKCGNVVLAPDGIETTGITNGVKIENKRIYCSGAFNPEQPDYRKAMEWLLEAMDKLNYTVIFLDVDSLNPSGADLSCTVCNMENYPPKSLAPTGQSVSVQQPNQNLPPS
jgi:N-dimethylarginine dimethylaminohydrolase